MITNKHLFAYELINRVAGSNNARADWDIIYRMGFLFEEDVLWQVAITCLLFLFFFLTHLFPLREYHFQFVSKLIRRYAHGFFRSLKDVWNRFDHLFSTCNIYNLVSLTVYHANRTGFQ